MNIIDTEDMIKGLPDAALQKEAQNPSGQAPQFLVVSEIKRRKDMRERYAQNQQSQGTVKDQLLGMNAPSPQPQMASMGQPQGRPMPPMGGQMPMGQPPMQQPAPPMGMYGGGVIRMDEGGKTVGGDPVTEQDKINIANSQEERYLQLLNSGYSPEEIDSLISSNAASLAGLQPSLANQMQDSAVAGFAPFDRYTGLVDGLQGLTGAELESRIQKSPDAANLAAFGGEMPQGTYVPYGDEFLTDEQLAAKSSATAPERIQGLQFPSGVSGVEPSGSRPQGNDQARMIAEQAARLNQAQRIKDSQAQSVQPPQNETVAKLRDENRDPNRMSLAEVRKIPGYENMEMNEERTVNRTLNIFPRTPPEVSKQIKALFRNNKPVEAQELANQYKPEPQRDPYVAMQGDLIKMPEQRPVGIEQLVAAGTNGVGVSGVGADIKAGLERQAKIDALPFDREVDEYGNISMLGGLLTGTTRDSREKDPSVGVIEGLKLGSDYGANYRRMVEQPKGSYDALVEKTTQQVLDSKTRQLGEIGARIAEINETQDTSNPRVQKTLAGLVKDQEKLTASIASGSGNAQSEDAAKLNRTRTSTTVTQELQDIAAEGNNKGNITVVPNADDSYSDAATGTTLAGLDLGKTTGSSILDNQSGGLSDDPYGSLTSLRGQQKAIAERRKAEAIALNEEEKKYKELLENRQRPTLSYDELIRESEQNMATQLADIKDEKGTQALIALGAGIASGNLAKGLSDAGKAVATSNAQKRALEARQQAVRMGFRKSEVDAVYQNQVAKENDKLEGMKFSLDSLRRLNASTADAEQIVLNFDTGLETTLAKLQQSAAFKAEDRAKQDALNRRAVLEYVNKAMDLVGTKLLGMTDAQRRDLRNSFLIQGSSYAEIPVPDAALAGSTGSTTSTASPATTTIGGYSVTQK